MAYRAIIGGRAFTPAPIAEPTAVLIHDERIEAVGPQDEISIPPGCELIDHGEGIIAPGLIDLHTHGLLGFDVMGDGLADAIAAYPSRGVTSFLATTLTQPSSTIEAALHSMDRVLRDPQAGADCLGIHLEGPYLAASYAGMAEPQLTHDFDTAEFKRFQDACGSRIRLITAAPERFPDFGAIHRLTEAGVRVSLGHTGASFEQTDGAIRAGARRASHLFNAMRGFDQRSPGAAIALLLDPLVYSELIADGTHVAPPVIELARRVKGPNRLVMVSDSAPIAGLPDGTYTWADLLIQVQDQRCQRSDGTLAGSWYGLDQSIRTLVRRCGLSLSQAITMVTQTPAESMGLVDRGRLSPGLRADLCVFDEDLNPVHTIVAGRTAWRSEAH